jgi:hypothetical protein
MAWGLAAGAGLLKRAPPLRLQRSGAALQPQRAQLQPALTCLAQRGRYQVSLTMYQYRVANSQHLHLQQTRPGLARAQLTCCSRPLPALRR